MLPEQNINHSLTDTVFIIKQNQKDCDSLINLINSKGLKFECFDSAEQFLADLAPNSTGCLVTEYQMIGMSGIKLIEHLSYRNSDLPVIILTDDNSIPIAVKAMKAGANNILENSCSDNKLWDSIRDAIRINHSRMKDKHKRELVLSSLGTLTEKERGVMELVIEGNSNKQIAKNLDLGLRTIEARRNQIRKKLGTRSTAETVSFYIRACIFESKSNSWQSDLVLT